MGFIVQWSKYRETLEESVVDTICLLIPIPYFSSPVISHSPFDVLFLRFLLVFSSIEEAMPSFFGVFAKKTEKKTLGCAYRDEQS